jgi:hypothetical protein
MIRCVPVKNPRLPPKKHRNPELKGRLQKAELKSAVPLPGMPREGYGRDQARVAKKEPGLSRVFKNRFNLSRKSPSFLAYL